MIMPPKRKSTGGGASASKKAKTVDHGPAAALASEILDASDTYTIPEDDTDVREMLVELAQYARYLEEKVEAGAGGGRGRWVSCRGAPPKDTRGT